MQNNTQYTRCPQCETAFKVNQKMLAMAHGKVRCGACLKVFQATEHLLQPREKNVAEMVTNDRPTQNFQSPASSTEPELPSRDETLNGFPEKSTELPVGCDAETIEPKIGDLDVIADKPEIVQEESAVQASQPIGDTPFDTPEDDDMGLTTTDLDEDLAEDDFSDDDLDNFDLNAVDLEEVNLDTLDSDDEKTVEEDAALAVFNEKLKQEEDALDLDENYQSAVDGQSNGIQNDPPISEWDDQDLSSVNNVEVPASVSDNAELEVLEAKSAEEWVNAEESEIQGTELKDALAESFDTDEFEGEDFDDESFELSEPDLDDFAGNEKLAENLVEQMSETDTDPDPLEEFEGRVETKKTGLRNTIIAVTVTVLVLVLVTKFWTNRQALAWDDTWGGVTKAVCGVLPCDLKPRRALEKIRTLQRIVTPSDENEGELDIKLLLTNEATFDQPYPIISIKFSNSRGQQVAQKKFAVSDYNPEWQDQMMPAGAEIHISFSTELPHPDALGFEIIFQ